MPMNNTNFAASILASSLQTTSAGGHCLHQHARSYDVNERNNRVQTQLLKPNPAENFTLDSGFSVPKVQFACGQNSKTRNTWIPVLVWTRPPISDTVAFSGTKLLTTGVCVCVRVHSGRLCSSQDVLPESPAPEPWLQTPEGKPR